MRIIAGEWRGRPIGAPRGTRTRPTSDRVREAVFDMLSALLGADLARAAVLDAYAGSGALGLEALSRGARHATFVERDVTAMRCLEANVAALGAADRVRIIRGDAALLLRAGRLADAPFSLLFADPPYRIGPAQVTELLEDMANAGLVASGAAVVWERAAHVSAEWPAGFAEHCGRRYGRTAVGIGIWEGGPAER